MDAASLRAAQAPLKEKYKADPAAARQTLVARGEVDFGCLAIRVEQPHADRALGLHRATGGSGELRCSSDMLLEALVGCAGTTNAPRTTIDRLLSLTERYRVVAQTLTQRPSLSATLVRT